MAIALVVVPLLLALVALAIPSNRARPWSVVAGGAAHLALTVVALFQRDVSGLAQWLGLDEVARLVLGFTSLLFFLCSIYARGYLLLYAQRSNRLFCACLLAFIGILTLVIESQRLGLMWVAIETTTLASAPLVYFHRTPRSLEAMWKYLLIGSVGIALALLGSLFLAYSALKGGVTPNLVTDEMVKQAPNLSRPWLRAAFVVFFIGYGTKMGLAPMHTWKPDAYGEAPGVVGALLAGGLTNGSFLAILRCFKICAAAHDDAFARELMVGVGLLSMAVAGVFMIRQRDIKRMLAYSSVEHMGILVVGVGLGGAGVFGSMLHMLNNGITKGMLFLTAANIQRAYDSKSTDDVRGALRRVPVSGALMLAGFFAVTGSPPFGMFLSELTILDAAIGAQRYGVAAIFLVMLAIVFIGMGATVLSVVQGKPSEKASTTTFRDDFATVGPGVVLLGLALLFGVWIPRPIHALLAGAAASLQVTAP
jgi:hydrogenase-4 component F